MKTILFSSIFRLFFTVCLLFPLLPATAQILEGTDPPFSQTQDILRGEYEVLPVDDLFLQSFLTTPNAESGNLISSWTPSGNGDANTDNRILLGERIAYDWFEVVKFYWTH